MTEVKPWSRWKLVGTDEEFIVSGIGTCSFTSKEYVIYRKFHDPNNTFRLMEKPMFLDGRLCQVKEEL